MLQTKPVQKALNIFRSLHCGHSSLNYLTYTSILRNVNFTSNNCQRNHTRTHTFQEMLHTYFERNRYEKSFSFSSNPPKRKPTVDHRGVARSRVAWIVRNRDQGIDCGQPWRTSARHPPASDGRLTRCWPILYACNAAVAPGTVQTRADKALVCETATSEVFDTRAMSAFSILSVHFVFTVRRDFFSFFLSSFSFHAATSWHSTNFFYATRWSLSRPRSNPNVDALISTKVNLTLCTSMSSVAWPHISHTNSYVELDSTLYHAVSIVIWNV